MPIYEYMCDNCNNTFDVFTTYENRNNIICSKCGNKNVKILVSKLGYMKHPTQVAENNYLDCNHTDEK